MNNWEGLTQKDTNRRKWYKENLDKLCKQDMTNIGDWIIKEESRLIHEAQKAKKQRKDLHCVLNHNECIYRATGDICTNQIQHPHCLKIYKDIFGNVDARRVI